MVSSKKHIIIAENQFLIVEALQKLMLDEFPNIRYELADSKQKLLKALAKQPNSMVILDFNNIVFENAAEIKRMLLADPNTNILLLANALQKNELIELNSIGIHNILLKDADGNEFVAGIESALLGKKYYCQRVLELFSEIHRGKPAARDSVSLTPAEIAIVKAIAEGRTTKQIAAKKFISYHTVMTHRKNIFRKLAINNSSELVMFAIRSGIVDAIDYQI